SFDEVKDVATGMSPTNLMTSLQKDVSDGLQLPDLDKPIDSQVETSIGETVVTPTTPAAPSPDTFIEAEAHQAASEPLIITREVQAAVPQDITPPAQEIPSQILKDAKAS
ncbi:MAG: twin-arginine translocase subunit TatB, partial [Bradyrhizobium guangdongense]